MACVEIREAYLFKESTETMQIEGQAREGRGATICPSGPERGRREEKGGEERGERSETKTMKEWMSQMGGKGV